MDGVCLRRGREGVREATGSWIVPSLWWKGASHGCGNAVEILLLASVLQDQEEVFLYSVCQTIGIVLLIIKHQSPNFKPKGPSLIPHY